MNLWLSRDTEELVFTLKNQRGFVSQAPDWKVKEAGGVSREQTGDECTLALLLSLYFLRTRRRANVIRPGSNEILHMTRTQLGSCNVRLILFGVAKAFFLHAWPAVNNGWRATLGQTAIFTWAEPNAQSGLKAPFWLYLEKPLNKTAFVIYFVWEIGSTELSSTFDSNRRSFNYLSRPKLPLGSAHTALDPGLRETKHEVTVNWQKTAKKKLFRSVFNC